MKQTLEQQYDVSALTELENDIRAKEAAINKVQDQIEQIRKVGTFQERALSDLSKEDEIKEKVRAINDEARRAKAAIKEASDQAKELDRHNKEQHRYIMDMDDRCRKLQALLQSGPPKKSITNASVTRLEPSVLSDQQTDEELLMAVKAAAELAREEEKKLKKQIYEVDMLLAQARSERDIEEARVKEKDQDLRICEMKIREMRRQQAMAVQATKASKLP